MNSKDIRNLCEAYVAVYDDDLRDELETYSIEEDLSFIDDLSDNELTQIMEEIFDENFIEIDECFESLDLVLSEATVTTAAGRQRRVASSSARVTSSAGRRAEKTAERTQKVRVGRLAQAAQRAAEYPGKKAKEIGGRAKTLAGGAVSAASEKIQRGKERVKGFLGRVGRAAKAGYSAAKSAAKKEFMSSGSPTQYTKKVKKSTPGSGDPSVTAAYLKRQREKYRSGVERSGSPTDSSKGGTGSKSARPALSGTPERRALPPARTRPALSGTLERRALPPVGKTKSGRTLNVSQRRAQVSAQNRRLRQRLGIPQEDFEFILDSIFENMINDGYAIDLDEALEILESLSEFELDDLMESYLEDEEVETLDLYDVVVEHLIDEGYADDIESAEVIMVNMSEEWRDEILDEARVEPWNTPEMMAASRKWKKENLTGGMFSPSEQAAARRMRKRSEREEAEKSPKSGKTYLGQKPKPSGSSRVRHSDQVKYM